ncbi:hypothetical protein P7C70_g263, partial [Phenoliferia sp. Uapishka_3]
MSLFATIFAHAATAARTGLDRLSHHRLIPVFIFMAFGQAFLLGLLQGEALAVSQSGVRVLGEIKKAPAMGLVLSPLVRVSQIFRETVVTSWKIDHSEYLQSAPAGFPFASTTTSASATRSATGVETSLIASRQSTVAGASGLATLSGRSRSTSTPLATSTFSTSKPQTQTPTAIGTLASTATLRPLTSFSRPPPAFTPPPPPPTFTSSPPPASTTPGQNAANEKDGDEEDEDDREDRRRRNLVPTFHSHQDHRRRQISTDPPPVLFLVPGVRDVTGKILAVSAGCVAALVSGIAPIA